MHELICYKHSNLSWEIVTSSSFPDFVWIHVNSCMKSYFWHGRSKDDDDHGDDDGDEEGGEPEAGEKLHFPTSAKWMREVGGEQNEGSTTHWGVHALPHIPIPPAGCTPS